MTPVQHMLEPPSPRTSAPPGATQQALDIDDQSGIPDDALVIVPVRHLVLFPGMVVPIAIGRQKTIAAAQYAIKHEASVGVLLQNNFASENPGADDLVSVGTVASMLRYVTTPDDTHHIICQGQQRFRVAQYLQGYPFIVAKIERIEETPGPNGREIEARFLRLKARAVELLRLAPQVPEEMLNAVLTIEAPATLADLVAGYLDIKTQDKQELLEEIALRSRLDKLLALMVHRIAVLQISREIDQNTKTHIEGREREFLLREQMKSIQRELGEDGSIPGVDQEELRKLIQQAGLPEDVQKQADKELRRLERMPDSSTEYSMLRSYLEWLAELPWKAPEPDVIDVKEAGKILDADHFGLDQVKKRILEFLAVRQLKPSGHGPILCLVGPPGVGKTSLGQSIARALGKKFARVSLGGVHDEAEIRGHRRTYIGALPGNIIQALKKVGTRGCVMMLDEIDKLGAGLHGDPAAALLEVLDPAQNNSFRDNYLGVPFDLSQVLFIATANTMEPIAGPLRDRMEVLQLSGYTREEKGEIARKFLVARQLDENGLTPEQLVITPLALAVLIRDYTREAGVRALERQIGAVCRRVAMQIAAGEAQTVRVDEADVAGILGPAKFEDEVALRVAMPGVATGLAWTPVGGAILFIEASRTSGSGRLIMTGQLGEVMKESAQAALTLVKSRATTLGLDTQLFKKTDLHIHVPAGAIPKDGPSAGVALFIALASLFMDRPVAKDVAMTGEISLRGLVLPVGGIKEKVIAALAAGIKRVMLPERNQKDLDDVPVGTRQQIEFIFLKDVALALEVAVGHAPAPGVTTSPEWATHPYRLR